MTHVRRAEAEAFGGERVCPILLLMQTSAVSMKQSAQERASSRPARCRHEFCEGS